MISLKEKRWKEFCLGDIFNISSGKRLTKANQKPGDIPYISGSALNNGITNFVSNINESYDKNCLGVIYEGEGGVGYSFYHPYNCIFADTVKRFHLKNIADDKYVYLFFSAIILKQRPKYSYNYSFNETRMLRQIVLVPVNNNEEPDYEYMRNYAMDLEKKCLSKIKTNIKNKLSKIKYKEIDRIEDKNFFEFKVGDIFDSIEKCKCSNASKLLSGDIPYVGATNRNNGVLKYVNADDKKITKGNCIVFICDGQGSVGYSVYKKENFVGSTTLKVGRNKYLNEYIGQFLVSALDKNRLIYSFGFKRKEDRLKNERILLPVDDNGKPDYNYMEQFIMNKEIIKLNKYLNYLEKKSI